MTKLVALLLIVAGFGWYYFIGGRQLDEDTVRAYYVAQEHAVLSRDPKAQCDLFAPKLKAHIVSRVAGQTHDAVLGKAELCKLLDDQAAFFEQVGEKAGGTLTIEYVYDIKAIRVAANKRSAEVDVASTLKMGEAFMEVSNTSTDRIERHLGKVQTVAAEARTGMRWTPGALANPEKYFQAQ